jgi:Cu+-exporting ATPase
MQQVKVNFMGGDVSFEMPTDVPKQEIAKGIEGLGYHVVTGDRSEQEKDKRIFKNHFQRFLFCAIFTDTINAAYDTRCSYPFFNGPLCATCLNGSRFYSRNGFLWPQCDKKFIQRHSQYECADRIGCSGRIRLQLIRYPNGQAEQYMFYETTATILTLVFLGNWMEDKSVETTQKALKKLAVSQKTMANMIAYDEQHQEHVFPVESSTLKSWRPITH